MKSWFNFSLLADASCVIIGGKVETCCVSPLKMSPLQHSSLYSLEGLAVCVFLLNDVTLSLPSIFLMRTCECYFESEICMCTSCDLHIGTPNWGFWHCVATHTRWPSVLLLELMPSGNISTSLLMTCLWLLRNESFLFRLLDRENTTCEIWTCP